MGGGTSPRFSASTFDLSRLGPRVRVHVRGLGVVITIRGMRGLQRRRLDTR